MWSKARRARKEPERPAHPEFVYVLSVIEYHHQANASNSNLLGSSQNSWGNGSQGNGSFSLMDIGGVQQYQSYNHNRNYASSGAGYDDGTITTAGMVPPSFRTLGVFENKDDAVIQLPKFKTQTGDMAFPHRHADPGTLYRRHRIVINIENREDVPDQGIILELEYNDGYCKRRDQVCISKMPYFPYIPSANEEDKDMREINIIDLRQQGTRNGQSSSGGKRTMRKARSSNALM